MYWQIISIPPKVTLRLVTSPHPNHDNLISRLYISHDIQHNLNILTLNSKAVWRGGRQGAFCLTRLDCSPVDMDQWKTRLYFLFRGRANLARIWTCLGPLWWPLTLLLTREENKLALFNASQMFEYSRDLLSLLATERDFAFQVTPLNLASVDLTRNSSGA